MLPFCNFPCTPFQNNKANKSTLKLISVLIVSFGRSSEIDKLKKQGVVRHQICFNVVANFLSMRNCTLRKFKVSVIILGFIDYCVKYPFIFLY